jgi:hypothetical protein
MSEEKEVKAPLKADIVGAFYNQEALAEPVCWGLAQNREQINNILVCNDDLWRPEQIDAFKEYWLGPIVHVLHESRGEDIVECLMQEGTDESYPPMYLLEHPHEGFGPSTCCNQGFAFSDAEYIMTIGYDQIMPPKTLETILLFAQPNKVIIGSVHHMIPEEFSMDLLPDNVKVHTPDWRTAFHQQFFNMNRQWMVCHNGHNLWPREAVRRIGGFEERYNKFGVTMEDWEFSARWLMAYGPKSMYFGPTYSWHFGDRHNAKKREERGLPSDEFRAQMARTIGRLYDGRYYFFPDPAQKLVSHANIIPGLKEFPPVFHDVRTDCYDLGWMEDDSAKEVIIIAGHEWIGKLQFKSFINTLMPKLQDWSAVKVFLPEDANYNADFCKKTMETAGLEIDEFRSQVIIGVKEGADDEEDTDGEA